jgi:hypothetical protein
MKYIFLIVLMILSCMLIGCDGSNTNNADPADGATYKDITKYYHLPPELKDCKIYFLAGELYGYMQVMYCPNKTVQNDSYRDGKQSENMAIVHETQTYPLGKGPAPQVVMDGYTGTAHGQVMSDMQCDSSGCTKPIKE